MNFTYLLWIEYLPADDDMGRIGFCHTHTQNAFFDHFSTTYRKTTKIGHSAILAAKFKLLGGGAMNSPNPEVGWFKSDHYRF